MPDRPTARTLAVSCALALTLALAACGESEEELPPRGEPVTGQESGEGNGEGSEGNGGSGGEVSSDSLSVSVSDPANALREGEGSVELTVSVERAAGYDAPLTLSIDPSDAGSDGLLATLADERLDAGDTVTTLSVSLPIGPLPRQPGTRSLTLLVADPDGAALEQEIAIETLPTERPDIYLLAGQSNMVGASRDGARRAAPGEPDAPDPRILQLDVTPNDPQRFPSPASYTALDTIAVTDDRIVEALDPLHDTRDRGNDTKSNTAIGMGLSFAKAALPETTAEIVLVPAAWSDTGFCARETNRFRGSGWNASQRSRPFAGSLLHDRAIARTDLAIAETGGVLRGILWHQGEADSDLLACAEAYADNLRDMVASLRTNIAEDARGPAARGPEADIPFVLGTMAMGDDERGPAMAPFGEVKSIVDGVHRTVSSVVPLSAVAIADDLVPANGYPCGQGFCIHFGAEALRELGDRYHERLRAVFEDR